MSSANNRECTTHHFKQSGGIWKCRYCKEPYGTDKPCIPHKHTDGWG